MQYVILFFFSLSLHAAIEQYSNSGLIRSFEAEPDERQFIDEKRSIEEFKKQHFPFLTERHMWKEVSTLKDGTHSHRTEALYYEGRRVYNHYIRTHYNNRGFLEYVSSSLSHEVRGYTVTVSRDAQVFWQEKIREEFESTFGRKLNGGVQSEPVLYLDPDSGEMHSALEIHLVNHFPLYVRHLVLDEMTGKVLSEKQNARSVDVSAKVYTVSPYNSATASSVTLSVTSADKLLNSNLHVRREENANSPTLVDITPGDYTTQISADPASYNATCTGGSSDCPNQAFDGVNVFYHLSRYRTRIGSYLSDMGVTVNFLSEPIPTIVNALTLRGYATGELTNNAQYVQGCRADGSMPRCMVFFRPTRVSQESSELNCNTSTPVQFHDFAREALVIAHEYQHYVTDMMTFIVFGCDSSGNNCAVGDALHEAYSDYLGASYVTEAAGRNVTLVGEYGLQNCSALQRELATLKVYANDDATKDSHIGGLTWASGFWKLRTEYGVSVVDKLVLKSLTFLSTSPSFVDSVESLVKADNALYDGVHVTRIRQLFYDELKIIAGNSGIFRDSSKGIVEMGTKGCSSVSYSSHPLSAVSTLALFIFWLCSTITAGRIGGRIE